MHEAMHKHRREPNPPHWKHPLLTREEQRRLVARAKARDLEIALAGNPAGAVNEHLDRLVLHSQRLILAFARRSRRGPLDLEDLVSAGNRGLIHAVRTFDHSRGTAFATHAGWWIRSAIIDEVENTASTIRTPRWVVALVNQYRRERKRLAAIRGAALSFDAVCDSIGISAASRPTLRKALATLRVFAPVLPDELTARDEAPDESDQRTRNAEILALLLRDLNPDERELLAARYGLAGGQAQSLGRIGHRCGRTKERIRQREMTAIRRMRAHAARLQLQLGA